MDPFKSLVGISDSYAFPYILTVSRKRNTLHQLLGHRQTLYSAVIASFHFVSHSNNSPSLNHLAMLGTVYQKMDIPANSVYFS